MSARHTVIFATILFLILLSSPSLALAITPSPTLTPTKSLSPTENPDEVQRLRQAVQDKVREKLNQIINQPIRKGWVGTITQINSAQITIKSTDVERILTLASDLTVSQLGKKSDLAKLKVGQTILCLGYLQTDGSLDTHRLIVLEPKDYADNFQIVAGRIVDTSSSSPVMVLVPLDNKNIQYQIKIGTTTKIINRQGQKLDSKFLISGQKIVAVLQSPTVKTNKTYSAIHIIFLTDPLPTPTPTTKPKPTPTVDINNP